jgi:UDP-N-acetylglucosamine 1-carboxyvinyltransferase
MRKTNGGGEPDAGENKMDRFKIEGGRRLEGTVHISGAKNAALPAMAAALLTSEPVRLQNIPHVRDIITMAKLLAHMRCRVESPDIPPSEFVIQAETVSQHAEAPYELVKTMRASVLTLGPLLARLGHARVSLPGGCAIGARPIDIHIQALVKLGAQITTEHGYVEARAQRLRGTHFQFPKITVTGTENILTAAVLAEGETVLENAAREPEVVDLAELLTKMGAQIEGAGTPTIRVRGVARLHGATHAVIPDRIEAGTFLAAGAITGGELLLTGCDPSHFTAVTEKFRECGVEIRCEGERGLRVRAAKQLVAADVTTGEYPGFATDMQAQFMALVTQARGVSHIRETIFENRFLHASEMMRMGARILIDGNLAVVTGPTPLSGAPVTASDLRASASLVLAGLIANNTTWIDRVYHIDRGYERIEEKLRGIGARIERVAESSSD